MRHPIACGSPWAIAAMLVYAAASAVLAALDQAHLRHRPAASAAGGASVAAAIIGLYLLKGIGAYSPTT
mgnify:CR=1 FL=1